MPRMEKTQALLCWEVIAQHRSSGTWHPLRALCLPRATQRGSRHVVPVLRQLGRSRHLPLVQEGQEMSEGF